MSETRLAIFDQPERLHAAPAREPVRAASSIAEQTRAAAPDVVRCWHCGSTSVVNVPIHGGQSTRRDCSRCAATQGFPIWYGIAAPIEPLPTARPTTSNFVLATGTLPAIGTATHITGETLDG